MAALPPLQARRYHVEVITDQYMLAGVLEPFGSLMNYLNHPERKTFQFKEVTASALEAANVVRSFQADSLWLYRERIILLRPLETLSSDTIQLLPTKEKLRVLLPRFIVQATFHRGLDTAVGDMFDSISGHWAIATEAQIYAFQPSPAPLFHEARQLLINRAYIQAYIAVK